MLKLTILLALATVVEMNIQDFYGNWTSVILYPNYNTSPMCLKYSLAADSSNTVCTCADGKDSTLTEMKTEQNGCEKKASFPLLEVSDVDEVTSAMNVICQCPDEQHSQPRLVIKKVNDKYAVLHEYKFIGDADGKGIFFAMLMAKTVPNYADALNIVHTIEDLKDRKGSVMCTEELVKMGY